ncbi:MAG: HAD family hydrolase [Alkalispirochaetaceae bacterium]
MTREIPQGCEALIFDMDGTLVDSTEVHFAAWFQTLASAGIELDRQTFRRLYGKSNAGIIREMEESYGRDLSDLNLASKKDHYFSRNVTMVMPNRPVVEVAEQYHRRLPLAVATNEGSGIANMVLRALGLESLFELLVSAEEVENPKPAPDLFILCAGRLGVRRETCHVFEDSDYGIEAARAAGMSVTDVRAYL